MKKTLLLFVMMFFIRNLKLDGAFHGLNRVILLGLLVASMALPGYTRPIILNDVKLSIEQEEKKADHKPNYTITVTATNGVEDTAYELYKTENGFAKVDLGFPILIDEKTLGDNRQVTFQVYLEQPTRLILMGKRAGKKVQYSIPAFPGSHAKIRTKSNDIEISGTGFYKEYADALEYSRNSTLQHTSEEAKELRRRYFINHSAEQGCLYAYQREMLLPIEDIFELFPDSLYDTTYGKLIKQAAESGIKWEESKYDDESIMFDDDEALMGTN